jgi:hypothetical protein
MWHRQSGVWLFGLMDTTRTLYSLLLFQRGGHLPDGQLWRLISFVLCPRAATAAADLAVFLLFHRLTLELHWGSAGLRSTILCGMLFNILYGVLVLAAGLQHRGERAI